MQLAATARYTANIFVCGKIYSSYLDQTDGSKDVAGIGMLGTIIFHMSPADAARYTYQAPDRPDKQCPVTEWKRMKPGN